MTSRAWRTSRSTSRRSARSSSSTKSAYALVQADRDSFGKEALDTLIKMVEDHRDNLVVILAGYSGEMKQMIAQNPGVRSRFPTVIDFADYSPPELMEIAQGMV